MRRDNQVEYWELTENPSGEMYKKLIEVLCKHSDTFYFVTRKELKYNQRILDQFKPYFIERYQTQEWANTITRSPAATVYVIESNPETMKILQESANALYDWVAPNLPEDLTFLKNNFEWFTCTTHEEFGGFSIRSQYYKNLMCEIPGLKIKSEQ